MRLCTARQRSKNKSVIVKLKSHPKSIKIYCSHLFIPNLSLTRQTNIVISSIESSISSHRRRSSFMLVLCAWAHLIHRPRPCGSRSFSASQNISSCAFFLAIWMRLMTWIKGLQNILSRGREAENLNRDFRSRFMLSNFFFLLRLCWRKKFLH